MSQDLHPLYVGGSLKSSQLDPKFKYEIAREPGGESIKVCFQCGKCVTVCPLRRVADIYRPRQILRAALLGMREVVLSSDVIWLCSQCCSCTDQCPQNVRLTEIMRAIRNIAVREGHIHPFFKGMVEIITNAGRLFENEEFINELRAELDLPPLPRLDLEELSKIFELTKVKEILELGKSE